VIGCLPWPTRTGRDSDGHPEVTLHPHRDQEHVIATGWTLAPKGQATLLWHSIPRDLVVQNASTPAGGFSEPPDGLEAREGVSPSKDQTALLELLAGLTRILQCGLSVEAERHGCRQRCAVSVRSAI
jgi:hypothetical protein